MKYILTIALVALSMSGHAQASTFNDNWKPALTTTLTGTLSFADSIVSRPDTIIKFKGIDTIPHQHNYVSQVVNKGERWVEKDIICTFCLRNCMAIDQWWFVKKSDPYREARERLKQYFKNQ